MKKLVLLLSVIALLIIATGVVSAAKPAPDTFTITGYQLTLLYELRNIAQRSHVVSCAGAGWRRQTSEDDAFCTGSSLAYPARPPARHSGEGLRRHRLLQLVSSLSRSGASSPQSRDRRHGSGKGKNEGVVTITAPDGTAVVRFNGKTDSQSVWGNFKIEKKEGSGRICRSQRATAITPATLALVFSVTFTGKLKD